MSDNIIRFPGTDEVEPEGIGAGHVPLVRLGAGVEALNIGGLVNALAALAHRAQRRRGTLRLSTNDLLAVQGIRELVVERDPQTHEFIFTARYLDDEE
jgi:hypothetical protein